MAFTPCTKVAIRLASTSSGRELAGRAFLLGSQRKGFPKYLSEPRSGYPHLVKPEDFGISPGASPEESAELFR